MFLLRRPRSAKPRVPQMLVRCPFHKLELTYQIRLQPPAVFHLRGGEPLAPSPGPRLRQICERTLRNLKTSEPLLHLLADCRCESAPRPRRVYQPITFPITEDQGIEVPAADR